MVDFDKLRRIHKIFQTQLTLAIENLEKCKKSESLNIKSFIDANQQNIDFFKKANDIYEKALFDVEEDEETILIEYIDFLNQASIDLSKFNIFCKEAKERGDIQENKNMKLKEYIKQLAKEILDEESATGAIGVGAGPIMTPYAFSKKGQKKNAATKYAEKEGWKVTKGETEMPSDSKVKDYKTLTGKKKKGVKIYNELSNYDQASKYGAASGYTAPSGYTGPSSASKGGGYYASAMKESLEKIVKEELLNEVTYSKFKNEVKFRTKSEQLHKAIREVKRKISEIDRIVEYTSRMKQELSEGEEGIKYWKATQKNIGTISEMVNQLNNKIKNLHQ